MASEEVVSEVSDIGTELVEKNGILVLRAGANLDANLDIDKLLEEDREERMSKLMVSEKSS